MTHPLSPVSLKPCPFCGSRNVFVDDSAVSYRSTAHQVVCNQCEAAGPIAYSNPEDSSTLEPAVNDAADAWNRRAQT